MLKNHPDSVEAPASEVSGALRARGIETILLVEDEEAVRTIARKILEGFGYEVIDADLPGRALAAVSARDGSIQLLLTDLVMPEMDGQKLAHHLVALRPEIRVLFMSGYADSPERYRIDRRRFIQKPFTPVELARRVREAIDAHDWS